MPNERPQNTAFFSLNILNPRWCAPLARLQIAAMTVIIISMNSSRIRNRPQSSNMNLRTALSKCQVTNNCMNKPQANPNAAVSLRAESAMRPSVVRQKSRAWIATAANAKRSAPIMSVKLISSELSAPVTRIQYMEAANTPMIVM